MLGDVTKNEDETCVSDRARAFEEEPLGSYGSGRELQSEKSFGNVAVIMGVDGAQGTDQ